MDARVNAGHVCRTVVDADGQVIASARVAEDASPKLVAALVELVEAARRRMDNQVGYSDGGGS